MARRISMVSGVARVQVFGAAKYAVRVQADPAKMAAKQIDLEQVRTAFPPAASICLPVRFTVIRRRTRFNPIAN